MNHIRNEMKLDAMDMSETYQAAASIQLRTHPSHSTINFSELGKKLLEAARNGDTEDVKELINTGAPFTTDWLGASPLHYASQYGHVDTAEALLRAGIAKDARTKIDRTALHVASQEGHINTVNVLVQYGADVDSKDMLKMTPLHWAVQRGHRDVMEILLEHGADVNIVNKFEKSPIDIAYTCGYHDFVPLLQNYKGRVKPKVNPIETTIPVKVLKNSNLKSRPNKSQNINRSFSNKVPINIKQEIDEDLDQDDGIKSLDMLESIGKQSINNKKDKDNMLQNVISNGQTISLTEAGKLVLNTYNKDQQQNTSNKKLITLYPQSNILLVSNSQSGTKSNDTASTNSSIKVIPKKPMFTEIKNTKSIPVDKLPFFNAKSGNQVIKRYVINTNQQNLVQAKDEEIKKLQEEIKNLKRELEDYKGLIISKDLEIEKIKKRKDVDK